jgi:hypothetical protein
VTLHQSPELSIYSAIATPEEQHPAATSSLQAQNEKKVTVSTVMSWLIWLYWFGAAIFGLNFLVQVALLLYSAYTRPVIRDGRFRIVELSGDKAPCSFGNNIFINPEKYDWETYNQILLHEKIHIEQGHTFDIVLAEIILVFQWFNPFAWLYRRELENNLEFLTDDQLLHDPTVEKTSYQMSLLKVSAPHFPLSLTTNYNQSLLKKRLFMMNSKRSSVHTTWKYFFLLPLLVLFVCLLNEPVAVGQSPAPSKKEIKQEVSVQIPGLGTEGAWFATIKGNKVSIQFKNDDDDENNSSSSSFLLSELKDLPKDKPGTFSITREAGTLQFTGKFEGDTGMGRYKFASDKGFIDFLKAEHETGDKDLMAFFMVDLKKSYIQMLKSKGYTDLDKNDLLPLAALKVDADYIESLKQNGFARLAIHELIPLKALGVDGDYIKEIRKAGYPNITANQLVTFKSQGINAKYIDEMRVAAKKEGKPDPRENDSPEEIISFKALNVDQAYIRSLKEVGYDNLSNGDLVAMKSLGITAEYIKNLHSQGYKNISASDLIPIKAQNITPEYLKSFEALGYSNISFGDAAPLKALGVTPEFIKNFRDIGFENIALDEVVSLKALGITPALVQEYKNAGFPNVSLDEVISAKATGTSPAFISSMKEKGHNLKSLQKYIQMKNAID